MLEPKAEKLFQRWVKSMLDAAGSDDPETFAFVAKLLTEAAGPGLAAAADQLRQPPVLAGVPGYSWADIAAPLGITKQTAWERFGRRRAPRSTRRPA